LASKYDALPLPPLPPPPLPASGGCSPSTIHKLLLSDADRYCRAVIAATAAVDDATWRSRTMSPGCSTRSSSAEAPIGTADDEEEEEEEEEDEDDPGTEPEV
jgi:hypothetical protein